MAALLERARAEAEEARTTAATVDDVANQQLNGVGDSAIEVGT